VSEIFELERTLVDAARRHYRRGPAGAAARARRRFARPLRIAAVPLALAALVLLVVAIARTAAPPREERPAVTATPASRPGVESLGRSFGVFRRPRRSSDVLPQRPFAPGGWRARTDQSRLVARAGDRRMYAYPASRPGHGTVLCTMTFTRRRRARAAP
jgi:hypothetical protein